jgi:hypothetical protein
LIYCEDDAADTVVPRLLAAQADLTRVHEVRGVQAGEKVTPFSLAHFQLLEQELERRPGVRLVVIDPAGGFIGRAGVDDHRDSELRTLLEPLAELAARRDVTILLIKHLNKSASAKAVDKVSGSVGYINTVRAAFLLIPDKDDPDQKLLLPIKGNLSRRPKGVGFRLVELLADERDVVLSGYEHLADGDRAKLAEQLFRIEWTGQTDVNPDDAVGSGRRKPGGERVQECLRWLLKFLAEHAYPSEEVFKAGVKAGFKKNVVYDAKDESGHQVRARKRGFAKGEVWWWGLGEPAEWVSRPEQKTP